jgi:hypothetical protein
MTASHATITQFHNDHVAEKDDLIEKEAGLFDRIAEIRGR